MLLTDLIRQVQRRFGDGIGSIVTESDCMDWVNEACIEIARVTEINSLEQSSTLATYLSTGYVETNSYVMIKYMKLDERFLELKDYKLFKSMYGRMDAVGIPNFYYFFSGGQDTDDPNVSSNPRFKLFPNPDSSMGSMALTVGLVTLPTPVTSTSSPIDLPSRYHPAVMSFCMMRAHERNKDWQAVKFSQDEFNAGISQRNFEADQIDTSWHVQEDTMFGL